MKATIYIVVLSLYYTTMVSAQGLDGSPAGVMISHSHPKDGWMFSYSYMNRLMKNNLSGTDKVNDETIFSEGYSSSEHQMQMDMHMLMAMYGFSGRLSGMIMASYETMNMDMTSYAALMHMHDGGMNMSTDLTHSHRTSGLGDIKLYALYKLLNGKAAALVFSLGLNLPAGDFKIDAGEHALYAGERETYMMQLGSGSYDLMPGLTYIQKRGPVSWSAQALGTIRPFYNSIGYHDGNELTVNAWASYQFCSSVSTSLRVEGITAGPIEGSDPTVELTVEPAANPANYGGQQVSGYAGINFYINQGALKNSKLGAEFGLPVYQNLNGPQLAIQSTLHIAFTKAF